MKEKLRFMAVCAHPDDMELRMGGTILKLTRAGYDVRIVCLTDGSAGHYDMPPRQLAERRRKEAEHVVRYAGLSAYEIWDVPDGCLEVNLANRERLIGRIREFAPDVLFTFRACDYHPDHRAAAQLAQDASYLVAAPMYLPHYPTPERAPVILMTHDDFTSPNVFSPTVAVAIDDVIDDKVEMMACHESQFFEWLAYDRFSLEDVPSDHAGRLKWLKDEWIGRDRRQAEKFKTLLNERYGSQAENCVFAETYELSEYGRIPKQGELHELLPE